MRIEDRVILYHLFEVLEAQQQGKPKTKQFKAAKECLLAGYAGDYEDVVFGVGFFPEVDPNLTSEVIDLLEVMWFIEGAIKENNLSAPNNPNRLPLKFEGFDGQSEPTVMGYARYLIEDRGMFDGISKIFNSHHPSPTPKYRELRRRWEAAGSPGFAAIDQETLDRIYA